MDEMARHEIFELEALEALKSGLLLEPLVFGGGTMLRLCFELNRYSTDLDFWFIKKTNYSAYFEKIRDYLAKHFEITDATIKFYTILLEMRKPGYPKRLKIEIRKEEKKDFEDRIAFSRYVPKQVLVRVLTLEEAMRNKVTAALDRKDIRDYFDIEFLLKRGIPLAADSRQKKALKEQASSFKEKDFKTALGSLLVADDRTYYNKHGFSYLIQKIDV